MGAERAASLQRDCWWSGATELTEVEEVTLNRVAALGEVDGRDREGDEHLEEEGPSEEGLGEDEEGV